MPYATLVERWDHDPAFYRAQTQGMIEEGKRPWTREDMEHGVQVLRRSHELGLAGRQAPNPGALPLQERIDRGLISFSGPRADGKGRERTTLARIERNAEESWKRGKVASNGGRFCQAFF